MRYNRAVPDARVGQATAPQQYPSPLLERLGIYTPLAWGYLGLLLFMIGDGVESGYLSPYLSGRGISQSTVAMVFTIYGVTAAVSAWLSGHCQTCSGRFA